MSTEDTVEPQREAVAMEHILASGLTTTQTAALTTVGTATLSSVQLSNLTTTQLTALCVNNDRIVSILQTLKITS